MSGICRLCLTEILLASKQSIDECTLQKEKIKFIMPEIDTDIISIFSICTQCMQLLNSAYDFKNSCMEVENFIKTYAKFTKASELNLEDLRKQKFNNYVVEINCQEEVKIDINHEDIESQDIVDPICIKVEKSISLISDKCDKSFDSHEHFENHLEGCSVYPHEQAEEILYNEGQLENQKVDNPKLGPENKNHTCDLCNETFNRTDALNRHITVVHSKSSTKLKCNLCDKILAHKNSLKQHILTHTSREKKHSCDICNKSFYKLTSLLEHKEIHTGGKYTCTICSKSYTASRTLKKHINNIHFGKYVCDTCGLKCASKAALTEHIRTHTGEKPFRCEICGKGFAQSGSLNVHIRCTHNTEKPHACEICGKEFAIASHLRSHTKIHSAGSERNFTCTVCNHTFTSQKHLTKHAKRHISRNHKCSLCSKAFFLPCDLKKHMRVHTGEKPYECKICQKRFNQSYNLQIHLRSHRPKIKPLKQ